MQLGQGRAIFFAGVLAAGFPLVLGQVTARRVLLEVSDTAQKPVAAVRITVTSPDRSDFKKELVTNKKGQVAFLVPVEIRNVVFDLAKEGYQAHRESVDLLKFRRSQEELGSQIQMIIYRENETSPEQQQHARESSQKAVGLLEKGIALFNAGDFAGAAGEFEKAAEIKPDFFEAYQNLAAALFRLDKLEQAIATAEKALELNPQSAQLVRLLAVSHSRLGQEDKALAYQEKLKSLPDAGFSAEEYYNLAVGEANKGDDAEAVKYFEASVSAKPDFALAHYQLGLCYFRLNKLPEAGKELERYLALDPAGENAKTAKALLEHIK